MSEKYNQRLIYRAPIPDRAQIPLGSYALWPIGNHDTAWASLCNMVGDCGSTSDVHSTETPLSQVFHLDYFPVELSYLMLLLRNFTCSLLGCAIRTMLGES